MHVEDQVLAVLAEAAPLPVSTRAIEDRTGYGLRSGYGQLIYTLLVRLQKAGQVEKVTARIKPCYWRTLAAQVSLPPLTVCTDQDREAAVMTGTVYLLHFDQPYKHARHYVGWTKRTSSGAWPSTRPGAAPGCWPWSGRRGSAGSWPGCGPAAGPGSGRSSGRAATPATARCAA